MKHSPIKPKTYTAAEELIEDVSIAIMESGKTYKQLAEQAQINMSTVGNVATRKTKWPRHTTLFPLIAALGMKLTLSH